MPELCHVLDRGAHTHTHSTTGQSGGDTPANSQPANSQPDPSPSDTLSLNNNSVLVSGFGGSHKVLDKTPTVKSVEHKHPVMRQQNMYHTVL